MCMEAVVGLAVCMCMESREEGGRDSHIQIHTARQTATHMHYLRLECSPNDICCVWFVFLFMVFDSLSLCSILPVLKLHVYAKEKASQEVWT
jgi:hypothetical protein